MAAEPVLMIQAGRKSWAAPISSLTAESSGRMSTEAEPGGELG